MVFERCLGGVVYVGAECSKIRCWRRCPSGPPLATLLRLKKSPVLGMNIESLKWQTQVRMSCIQVFDWDGLLE